MMDFHSLLSFDRKLTISESERDSLERLVSIMVKCIGNDADGFTFYVPPHMMIPVVQCLAAGIDAGTETSEE